MCRFDLVTCCKNLYCASALLEEFEHNVSLEEAQTLKDFMFKLMKCCIVRYTTIYHDFCFKLQIF